MKNSPSVKESWEREGMTWGEGKNSIDFYLRLFADNKILRFWYKATHMTMNIGMWVREGKNEKYPSSSSDEEIFAKLIITVIIENVLERVRCVTTAVAAAAAGQKSHFH